MRFQKFDSLKSRLDLVPPNAIELVGFALRQGLTKYVEPNNWRKCKDHHKYVAAMLRHAFKHLKGDLTDPESGLLHLAHAVTSGLIALDLFVKIGEDSSMERKQFSYFALVERTSKRRGVVKKRFRSYEGAWDYLTSESLDPAKSVIKTVRPQDKVGQVVPL